MSNRILEEDSWNFGHQEPHVFVWTNELGGLLATNLVCEKPMKIDTGDVGRISAPVLSQLSIVCTAMFCWSCCHAYSVYIIALYLYDFTCACIIVLLFICMNIYIYMYLWFVLIIINFSYSLIIGFIIYYFLFLLVVAIIIIFVTVIVTYHFFLIIAIIAIIIIFISSGIPFFVIVKKNNWFYYSSLKHISTFTGHHWSLLEFAIFCLQLIFVGIQGKRW